MRAPQPSLIPRTVRGKNGHLPLDRRVVQLAPPAFFARLPIANQLRKETPDGGLTHEVVTAPRNRVYSKDTWPRCAPSLRSRACAARRGCAAHPKWVLQTPSDGSMRGGGHRCAVDLDRG